MTRDEELAAFQDRLATMNECVRTYVYALEHGAPLREGWLEEEVAATDALFQASLERAKRSIT